MNANESSGGNSGSNGNSGNSGSSGNEPGRRLDLLLDVPLDVSVELGRSRLSIQDLLGLGPGSVIELDKVAGEPLDILVNDRLVARGEAVVVNDKFGVRITDIVSQSERIARLR
jgi:flagellar motor switch protein FliN/FliY